MERGWIQDKSLPVAVLRFLQGLGLGIAFQPIADLGTGRVVGVESLARFQAEPQEGPDRWFERAEELGLRAELEARAISTALEQLANLPPDAYLTVNCSPGVACSGALDNLLKGMPLHRIIVEITEGERIPDHVALNEALDGLRARGLRVAIDDAGAGFAGMAQMIELRPDVIKLDIELTRSINSDDHRKALVRSLVRYATDVGATIVAEGIETKAELRALQALGVHFGQGYYLGRPGHLPSAGFGKISIPHRARPMRFRRPARVLVGLMAAVLLALPTAALADNSQPGDVLWPVKLKLEDVRLFLARSQSQKVSLNLEFTTRRTDELVLLALKANGMEQAMAVIGNLDRHARAALKAAVGVGSSRSEASVRSSIERRLETAGQAVRDACRSHSSTRCSAASAGLKGLAKAVAAPSHSNADQAQHPSTKSAGKHQTSSSKGNGGATPANSQGERSSQAPSNGPQNSGSANAATGSSQRP